MWRCGSATATSAVIARSRLSRPPRRPCSSPVRRSRGGCGFRVSKLRLLMPKVVGLRCRECGTEYELQATHVCEMCFGPLDAVYDEAVLRKTVSRERIEAGAKSM